MSNVTVKPLKWTFWDLPHDYGRGSWDANTAFDMYQIHDVSKKFPDDGRYYCPKVSDQFDTLEAAKAAAQADYEARILSAIEVSE